MGHRISLYRCPKNYVDDIRDTTDEDIENDDGILDLPRYELIKYDTLANVLDTGDEVKNNLCSRIFNNRLKIEDDMSFYTISKEQLRNIIEYIRENNIYGYWMDHTVDYDKKKMSDRLKDYLWNNATWENAVRYVCNEARWDAEMWGRTENNIDLSDNKWWIAGGLSYKYSIYNFVHILKCFDWENDYLVAIGG